MENTNPVTLRPGRPQDAADCGRICYDAFRAIAEQHNFPLDFTIPEEAIGLAEFMLSRPDVYAVVAEGEGGRIVGSNFLWKGDAIAGVGPITVDPSGQNGSVGRRLMEDVIEHARAHGHAGVRLVQAAYHGRSLSLYAKLGFAVREHLACMQGPAPGLDAPKGVVVRAVREGDLDACNELCRRVHGHDRAGELAGAVAQGSAMLVEREDTGRITGYATVLGFFGHTVGDSNDDLKALIGAAPGFAGPGILVPVRNADLFRWCLERGLRVTQTMNLMTTGLYNAPAGAFLPSILF